MFCDLDTLIAIVSLFVSIAALALDVIVYLEGHKRSKD